VFAGVELCKAAFQKSPTGFQITPADVPKTLLSGCTLFPFMVLGATVFSPQVMAWATTSKFTMALAGCVGAAYGLNETFPRFGRARGANTSPSPGLISAPDQSSS
jgi:hypothetical protein